MASRHHSSNNNSSNINYEDKRFQEVETDKKQAISELEKTYSGMVDSSDAYFQNQIDASKDWEKQQTQLQNEKTDFAIQEIEQQKDQAKKDYTKEQSGAYVDWQKQSNAFGAEAEQRAAQGLENTGFSESSKVSMFNNYQNRVSTALESYNRAILNFNNSITEARLQNNSALAEIAYKALQQQLELSLQGFQYKNTLLLEQMNKKTELEQIYHERWQDVLAQMNTENALAEEIRQFNASMALQREQFEWQKSQASGGGGGGGGGGGDDSSSSGGSASIKKTSDSGSLASDTRDSILALGQGPISAENLASQVSSGKVSSVTSPTTGNELFQYTSLTGSKYGL